MDSDQDYEYSDSDAEMESPSTDHERGETDEEGDMGLEVGVSTRREYRIMNKTALQEAQQAVVASISGMLCISDEDAMRLLREYKWDVNKAQEEWFHNPEKIKALIGIMEEPPQPPAPNQELQCVICYEAFPADQMLGAACQHCFCRSCWKGYVSNAISEGAAVLDLRCPIPKCRVAVPQSLVQRVADPAEWDKYQAFSLHSFVGDDKNFSWCPGVDCGACVECLVDRAQTDPLDVQCTMCGTAFCFACKEQAHRPTSCELVRQWMVKNSAESENTQWILANTKQCPKCKRHIEKNQGCMHMNCSQCKFEFCWLCLGSWKEHGERTGGYYNCNKYEQARRDGLYTEEDQRREAAKSSLERYVHYFERWDAHQKARKKAQEDVKVRGFVEKLSEATKTTTKQLEFVEDAWDQIIDCRRVLSWTYTYGYYRFDPATLQGLSKEEAVKQQQQKEFFEFLQTDAERSLETLHELAEKRSKELEINLSRGNVMHDYQEFRTSLIGSTDVTRRFFDRLVRQLEKGFDGLADDFSRGEWSASQDLSINVDALVSGAAGASAAGPSGAAAEGTARGDSASGAGPSNPAAEPVAQRTSSRASAGRKRTARSLQGTGAPATDAMALLAQQGFWVCTACTFQNQDLSLTACAVCDSPREPLQL